MGQLRAHEQILESLRAQIDDGSLGGTQVRPEPSVAEVVRLARDGVRKAVLR